MMVWSSPTHVNLNTFRCPRWCLRWSISWRRWAPRIWSEEEEEYLYFDLMNKFWIPCKQNWCFYVFYVILIEGWYSRTASSGSLPLRHWNYVLSGILSISKICGKKCTKSWIQLFLPGPSTGNTWQAGCPRGCLGFLPWTKTGDHHSKVSYWLLCFSIEIESIMMIDE